MSTADGFLITWWVLALVTGIYGFAAAKWLRQRQKDEVTIGYLREQAISPYRHLSFWTLPPPAPLLFAASALTLIFGLCVLTWMRHWTALLLFHFYLLMIALGAAFILVGSMPHALSPPRGLLAALPRAMMRPVMILFGLVALAFGLHHAARDFAMPRQSIEGRIDGIWDSIGGRQSPSIVLDGTRYEATRDAIAYHTIGTRVRGEIGAGSKTIYRLLPL
jgi:hypothetical protein